jgi:hypothetical protein
MAEPQIPGVLQGTPTEGNPAPVVSALSPGYTEGPTPYTGPSVPAGVTPTTMPAPKQRSYQQSGEWRW